MTTLGLFEFFQQWHCSKATMGPFGDHANSGTYCSEATRSFPSQTNSGTVPRQLLGSLDAILGDLDITILGDLDTILGT